jgi:hypothetical protein
MPDKSARRVDRPQGGPLGETIESSREIKTLDPGRRRGDALPRVSISNVVVDKGMIYLTRRGTGR